jgi:hypothetical protein
MYLRYRKANFKYGNFESRTLGDILGPFRSCWLWAPVFLAVLALVVVAGNVHPLLILSEGAGFAGIFLLSLWLLSRQGDSQGHIRFVPVLIRKVPVKNPAFFRLMLPYAFFALLAALLPPVFPGLFPPGASSFLGERYPVLHEAEYRAHAGFQASFSYRALGSGATETPAYFRYVLGDDGLITGKATGFSLPEDIPPFPLEDLMFFLETGMDAFPEGRGLFSLMDLAPVLLILLLSIPGFIQPAREDKKKKNRLLYRAFSKTRLVLKKALGKAAL